MLILIAILLFVAIAFTAFIVIAKKGRELRRNQPLPPPAAQAFLIWEDNGKKNEIEVDTPFYFGRDPECQVVCEHARNRFEACIFYHHSRFAIQMLPGSGGVRINEEDTPAGYLRNEDRLRIADREFIFRCY